MLGNLAPLDKSVKTSAVGIVQTKASRRVALSSCHTLAAPLLRPLPPDWTPVFASAFVEVCLCVEGWCGVVGEVRCHAKAKNLENTFPLGNVNPIW